MKGQKAYYKRILINEVAFESAELEPGIYTIVTSMLVKLNKKKSAKSSSQAGDCRACGNDVVWVIVP